MPLSPLFAKSTAKALEKIFKMTNAEIRLHGVNNIPDQPVLYVINHFTRIETVFLPYIIYQATKKIPLSLAHYSFFGGSFGNIMEKLGAVSSHHKDRDKVLTSALLSGDMSVIIFPEGQMLKDKKIIEKGKYLVYNAGVRRPPHTGAARLALRTEFYREKITQLKQNKNQSNLETYMDYFNLKEKDLDSITKNNTIIIPVNITYYPIRAKSNSINNLAGKFIKNISERFEEELEVEGTMLLDGVDIDINFGNPIDVKEYFLKSEGPKRLDEESLYLKEEELKQNLPFKKQSLKLMKTYMDNIYHQTTVNHDHIFSYILTRISGSSISEVSFKNRAFIAIERIKKLELNHVHTSMKKNQFHLLTDDEEDKYNSFVKAAISDNLIKIEDGNIIKNKKKFNAAYQFHSVRKDNIIDIFKNEIEPLRDVIKILNRVILLPDQWIRRKLKKQFLNLDREMFLQDYEKYFIKNESKPKNIGEPFLLETFRKKRGVLLIHGYMAAPEEIRPLADFLYAKGYTVYGARLRGHGTSPEDLAKRTWKEWYNSVNRAYIVMQNCVTDFAVLGFSTGAGISLMQAANKGIFLKGSISINAPLKLQNISSHLSGVVTAWNKLLKKMNIQKGQLEFVPNTPENKDINYFRNPIFGVKQLGDLMDEVETLLPKVQIPTLVIQGSDDPVVNPKGAQEIYEKIGSEIKEIYEINANHHGILRGKEFEAVATKVLEFLEKIF